jgi:hypothetical protein
LILTPQQARTVMRGAKTQYRLPARRDEDRCRFQVGKSYAVQPGRGRAARGRVLVTAVRLGLAGDVTFEDARAEGFRTRDEWRAAWVRLHDRAWLEQRCAYSAEGELVAEPGDDALLERFAEWWADRRVWALTFRVDTSHVPRMMHRQSERGYTSNPRDAVPDEPEAVDAATQARITDEARRRDHARRGWLEQQALDGQRSLEEQLAEVRRRGQRSGVDLRDHERAIQRRIVDMARKVARVDDEAA